MCEETHLRYVKFSEEFIINRCDNRKPQTVNKGREQRISFSCTFMFFAIFSPSSILFSSMWVYSISFVRYLFQLPLSIVFMVGVCLLVDTSPPFFKTRLTFLRIPLALFFLLLLLCSRCLIHPSLLDQVFCLSSLSFIWLELFSEQTFLFWPLLDRFFLMSIIKFPHHHFFSQMPHVFSFLTTVQFSVCLVPYSFCILVWNTPSLQNFYLKIWFNKIWQKRIK